MESQILEFSQVAIEKNFRRFFFKKKKQNYLFIHILNTGKLGWLVNLKVLIVI